MKKCPPGVICVENLTMFFLIIAIILVFYIICSSLFKQKIEINNNTHSTEKIVVKDNSGENPGFGGWFGWWRWLGAPIYWGKSIYHLGISTTPKEHQVGLS